VIEKSKQSGFTTLALAAAGYTIDVEPCDLFLIEPTDSSLGDFISLKLQPTIDGTPALAKKVAPQVARSGKGSTTTLKRFPGGTLLLATANSSAELRGKTRKKIIRDEAAEYPKDLSGQGSPHDMITGAYETFLVGGEWKDLWISTPTIAGDCAISEEFLKGDRRYWFVKCPGCEKALSFDYDLKFPFRKDVSAQGALCCAVLRLDHRKLAAHAARAIGRG
jgi:phage terminase large subunit GpA-like protein